MLSTKLKINNWLIVFPLIFSVVMSFYQLGRPDLNGDEYDLGYQAYNLVDGIFAGRKAHVLSFSAHPPLAMYIQHYTMNILSPNGLDNLSDEMYRVGPALVGVLIIAVVYLFVREIGSEKLGIVAASLLAVNGYQIFISRIFQRENFLTLFLILTLYTLMRFLRTKDSHFLFISGIFFGAAMLVKANALIILPVIFAILWWNDRQNFRHFLKRFLLPAVMLFFPVIIYNLGAYMTTGYSDIFFSRIFQTQTHPGARIVNVNIVRNLQEILLISLDQYGILIFAVMGISTVVSFLTIRDKWIRFFLIWIASIVLFYGINGVRVYYLPFITIPLLIITVIVLDKYIKNKEVFMIIILVLFTASFIRSSNTFFNYSFVSPLKDNDEIPSIEEIERSSYSLTSRRWLENRGWKNLRGDLDKIYTTDDCLEINPNISSLSLRRYLEVGDKIKRFYLGKDYVEPYKTCVDLESHPKIFINYDQLGVIRIN